MADKTTKDMTVGKPFPLIVAFTVPLFFGTLFQQVYSIVDTMIVGQFIGVNALAAVGDTGSLTFLIIGFASGLCSGFSIPIAQAFGAGDRKLLKKYSGNAAILSVISAIVLTAITVILCRSFLVWMNTPEDILQDAYDYLVIIFAGIPATILYNLLSGFLRALGDSKRPLYFLLISSALNIGLDLIFILVFGWGVRGASAATVLSQLISGLLCLVYILKKVNILHLEGSDYRLDKAGSGELLKMGFPMGFQYAITAIGVVILQTAVNSLGSGAVAAMTAAQKTDMFGECLFTALSTAMATYAGQNVGAEKYDRVRTGFLQACLLGCAYSIVMGAVFGLWGRYFIKLFVPASSPEVIELGYQCIAIFGLFYIPLALLNIARFTIQGMGFSAIAVLAGVAELIGRSLVAIIFVPVFGFTAACFASPIAWVFAAVFLMPTFFICLKKLSGGAAQNSIKNR